MKKHIEQLETQLAEQRQMYENNQDMLKKALCESEVKRKEIESELQKAQLNLKIHDFCEVCFTQSWAPCKETDEEALKLKDGSGFVQCQLCKAGRQLSALKAELEKLKNG